MEGLAPCAWRRLWMTTRALDTNHGGMRVIGLLACKSLMAGLERSDRELLKEAFSRATVCEVLESAMHIDSAKAMRAHEALVRYLSGRRPC